MADNGFHADLDACLPILQGFGFDERIAPGRRWWIDNRRRPDNGFVIFQWIETGRAVLRDADGDHPIGPGQAFLFVYGERTSYGRPPEPAGWPGHREELITNHVVLRGPGLIPMWDLLRRRSGPVIALANPHDFRDRMERHRQRFVADLGHDRWRKALSAMDLVRVLAEAVEASRATASAATDRAVESVMRDPLGTGSIKDISRVHGCSREHFCRTFARRVGCAPSVWLGRVRRERAVELVLSTDLPLATIALRCGAGTAHTLARWVREATGRSPRGLRSSGR